MGALLVACGAVDPAAELEAAGQSLDAGDYRAAAVHVGNVLQAEPANAEARVLRGRIALALGDYRSALAEFDAALDRGASPAAIALDLAETLVATGDPRTARERLAAVESEHAGDQAYWALRAEAAIADGAIDATTSALERAAALGESTSPMLIARAGLALARNDTAGAEASLDEAVRRFPDDPRVHEARGRFYLQSNRLEEAGAALARAAEEFAATGASFAEVPDLLSLVQVYLATNDPRGAGQAAERLAAIAPDSSISLYAQGLVAYQAGRFDEAARVAQLAANAQPDSPAVVTLLGAAHLALGNLGQAEQSLQRALVLAPGNPAATKLLAEVRLRQQRPQAALDALRPLASLGIDDAQVGLLTGLASIESGNTEQGILYLEQAASLRPDDQTIRLELARAYLAAGRSDDASSLLDEGFAGSGEAPELEAAVIRLFAGLQASDAQASEAAARTLVDDYPDEPRALTAVAVFELLHNDPDRADELLARALDASADYEPARLLQIDRLLQQGKTDEAEAKLLEAQARAPSLKTEMALVQLYLRAGRLDDAEPLLAAAAAEAPENPGVEAARGMMALARGEPGEATRYLAAAQSALPNQLGIVLALAQAQLAGGDPESAHTTITRVLERVPGSLPLRSALASIEIRMGNPDAAAKIAVELQAEFPRQSAGYLIDGEVAVARRRYDEAAASFSQAFGREPTWAIRIRWINALQLAGRDDEVLEQYLSASETDPDNVIALNNAAWMLYERGRFDEALPLSERAGEVAPENASVLDTLGWILVGSNREQEAIPYLEHAVGLAPDAVEIRYHLAVARARSGQLSQARQLLEQLLADGGQFEHRAAARELLESL